MGFQPVISEPGIPPGFAFVFCRLLLSFSADKAPACAPEG